MKPLSEIFPACRAILGIKTWQKMTTSCVTGPENFPDYLKNQGGSGEFQFISGLALIEYSRHKAEENFSSTMFSPSASSGLTLNPTLNVIPVAWKNLPHLLKRHKKRDLERVSPGREMVLVWCAPDTGEVKTAVAEQEDLLAIKLVVEETDPADAAAEAGVTVGMLDAVLRSALWKGLLISPPSGLKRDSTIADTSPDPAYSAAEVFTLQWHLTQLCDLHCLHCYDRSDRRDFPAERAITLLDELRTFCRQRFVRGQVSLTGGNPLLHPDFFDLYRAAAERDFMIAILGNASDRATMEKIVAIQMPVYFQVSLEGLEPHNDTIRGAGNYRRTIEFLKALTEMGVPNMVMLTLTRHNMEQIIPLADELEGVTDGLAFNRLALFGEGASLELPSREDYAVFLQRYSDALKEKPVLKLKDSLFNILFEKEGSGLFGGCAGYGCGAAFNFVSILSDGEVHACRKFPSPIGNILTQDLESVYGSAAARRYRSGSSACAGCSLNAVCRGCPAVTASLGLDPFTDKDPYCFKK